MANRRGLIVFLLLCFLVLTTLAAVLKFVEASDSLKYAVYILLILDVLSLAVLRFRKTIFRRRRARWATEEVGALQKLVLIVFYVLLFSFLAYLILKEFYTLSFVNMTYFLIAVVLFGILVVVMPSQEDTKPNYWIVGLLGIFGGVYIFLKVRELGWLAYVIGSATGLLVATLSVVVYEEEPEQ